MLSIIENLKVEENSMAQVCRRSEFAKRFDEVPNRDAAYYKKNWDKLSESQKQWLQGLAE